MAGKGDKNRTNVHTEKWSEAYDRIFGKVVECDKPTHVPYSTQGWVHHNPHPIGSCGGYCDQFSGGCDGN